MAIPEDMSVVGFDDTTVAEQASPPLTTVHVPLEEIGHTAVQMLDELIAEQRLTGRGITHPVCLVERGSTCRNSPRG